MSEILDIILRRRAVKVFDPVDISVETRDQILKAASVAPSSFNSQPYRFYWVQSPEKLKRAARLCFGQKPAATASALVVAVADIASWRETAQAEIAWMRTAGFFSAEKIAEAEKRMKLGKWFFLQGWFGIFGILKLMILRTIHLWTITGTVPVARKGMFKWAGKSAALACANLMIAAEALGLEYLSHGRLRRSAPGPVSSVSRRRITKSSWSSPSARNPPNTWTVRSGAGRSNPR